MIRQPPRSQRTATLFPDPTPCRSATQATRKTGDGDGGGSMTDGGAASRSAMTVQRPHFCNWRCHPFGGPWRSATWLRVGPPRSEEHTSELQSLMRISYAVFCLKKKTKL